MSIYGESFRDQHLATRLMGRVLIRFYFALTPRKWPVRSGERVGPINRGARAVLDVIDRTIENSRSSLKDSPLLLESVWKIQRY
jgi:hypothetical protein